jgi:hypothetical protein
MGQSRHSHTEENVMSNFTLEDSFFTKDHGTHVMHYDVNGDYIGQTQDNMGPGEEQEVFLSAKQVNNKRYLRNTSTRIKNIFTGC